MYVKRTGLKSSLHLVLLMANTRCSVTAPKLKHLEGHTQYYRGAFYALGQNETSLDAGALSASFRLHS
jgi:hypothetical protein